MTERYRELCRALTCGLTDEAFPMPTQYPEYFAKYLDYTSSVSERFQDYLIEAQTAVQGFRGLDNSFAHFRTHAIVEAFLDRRSSTRQISVTTNGRLACVPQGSQKGDVICILFGSEVPYV